MNLLTTILFISSSFNLVFLDERAAALPVFETGRLEKRTNGPKVAVNFIDQLRYAHSRLGYAVHSRLAKVPVGESKLGKLVQNPAKVEKHKQRASKFKSKSLKIEQKLQTKFRDNRQDIGF